MKRLKQSLMFLLLVETVVAPSGFGGDHTLATTVEVTQTAMNRYLNAQYNTAGFPRDIPVTVGGTTYIISLGLPEIILSTGNARLRMVFDVWQGTTLLYHFLVQPSVNIPSGQISASQIEAFLIDFQATLNAVIPILPSWVKDNILTNYNSRGWMVYPTRLINEASTSWFSQRGLVIHMTDLSLTWTVAPGALRLTISAPTTATVPSFHSQIIYNQFSQPAVVIRSLDINITVDEVRIYNINPTSPIQVWTNDVSLPKGEIKWWYANFTPDPAGLYMIWILFRSDDTFKVRTFRTDGSGISGNLVDSIN